METTNTKFEAFNTEISRRAGVILALLAERQYHIDEWDEKRFKDLAVTTPDETRYTKFYGEPVARIKMPFGTLRISLRHGTDQWSPESNPDTGETTQEWWIATQIGFDVEARNEHEKFAASLREVASFSDALREQGAADWITFNVVIETAAETAARLEREAAQRVNYERQHKLEIATTIVGRGMRVSSPPREVPLALLDGVEHGRWDVLTDAGKKFVVEVGGVRAKLSRMS